MDSSVARTLVAKPFALVLTYSFRPMLSLVFRVALFWFLLACVPLALLAAPGAFVLWFVEAVRADAFFEGEHD